MAISARTRDVIERTIRPALGPLASPGTQASEIVTALNNAALNTTLSKDATNKLKMHVGQVQAAMIRDMLKNGSKTNLTGSKGQDAWLRHALFHWLKDRDAANDVFTQIALVV